jgi:hypothetical protein
MIEFSRKKIFVIGLLVLCLTFVGCDRSDDSAPEAVFEFSKHYDADNFSVDVRIDKTQINLSGTLTLELEASAKPGYDVVIPAVDQTLEDFEVRNFDDIGSKLADNGNVVTTYRYRIEPLKMGQLLIPAMEFQAVEKDSSKSHTLATEPVEILVSTLLPADGTEPTLAEIEGVVELPAKPIPWWFWAVGAGLLAVLILVFVLIKMRKVDEQVHIVRIFKAAHEIALRRIDELEKSDLIETGRLKVFYEGISDILRHYIEDRFELNAPERTTEEFLYELQNAPANVFTTDDKDSLAEFLKHCDLVKFAKHQPDAEQTTDILNLVRGFVDKTKSAEHKVDVTGVDSAGGQA